MQILIQTRDFSGVVLSRECITGALMKNISIKDLLDAGIHFGHRTNRWNPKMTDFIYGHRNGIHIIDLQKTVIFFFRGIKSYRNFC